MQILGEGWQVTPEFANVSGHRGGKPLSTQDCGKLSQSGKNLA